MISIFWGNLFNVVFVVNHSATNLGFTDPLESLIKLFALPQMIYYLFLNFLASLGIQIVKIRELLDFFLNAVVAPYLNLGNAVMRGHCNLHVEDNIFYTIGARGLEEKRLS